MTALLLAGCRTAPLGGYLTGLGLLRAVTRTLDPQAAGSWRDQRFVLTSRFASVDALVAELACAFEPEAIVSPWNAGSGFAGNGKNVTAERALQQVRDAPDARLAPLAAAVRAGDEVVKRGRARGWGGTGEDLWDKARKPEVLRLCRNTFPDQALPWLDAAVALGSAKDPTFSRLLGTGGNFGRQDLSSTYVQRALSVLTDPRSTPWLAAALTGDESVPYLRDAVGQFDPGRAGGIQSSPLEKADDKGFVNPWSFLLTIEGALLFAGAVVRRLGAQFERPALPFQVRGSTAGFASAAADETALGEIWVPEWPAPSQLDQVQHLLTEGRAQWRDGPARTGLDFARAVASLGVDRGVEAFTRHVFVDRHGQSPLAVPAGRVEVTQRRGVGPLAELDPWLARLHGEHLPSGVAVEVRRVEQRLFDLASGDGGLVEVFVALGRLTESVARSGDAREASYPLELRRGEELLDDLAQPLRGDDLELRLALAFTTLADPAPVTLRPSLQPVGWTRGSWTWTERAAPAPLFMGLGAALAEAARRRAFPGAVPERVTDREPSVRGSRIAFVNGLVLGTADRSAFARGAFDADRLTDLLAGLLCVRWPTGEHTLLPGGSATPPVPALDVLLPFCSSGADPIHVRPGSDWPNLLTAGRAADVLADATRRLRIAGSRFVVDPVAATLDPHLLAASLLLPSLAWQRRAALDNVRIEKKETS
ncbi:MAG: type I-G CRISPR-associated protein Cas8g1/Csx17 [Pseudonocardia sp.]